MPDDIRRARLAAESISIKTDGGPGAVGYTLLHNNGDKGGDHGGDLPPTTYTRLNVPMCEHDEGTRPLTCGCPQWNCESIEVFPDIDMQAGEESTINVTIRNNGNMDATSVFMETAYTIFIDNNPESLIPISTQPLPVIPAGGEIVAEYNWTPPDTSAVHGCLHARVFDLYSMMHANALASQNIYINEWRSLLNPQAGWKNVRIIPIEDETKSIAVAYLAKNFSKDSALNAKVLVTEFNKRHRMHDIDEVHPLPFRPKFAAVAGTANREPISLSNLRGRTVLTHSGRRMPPVSEGGLWPRDEVNPKFVHKRFGIAPIAKSKLPQRIRKDRVGNFSVTSAQGQLSMDSLFIKRFKPLEEMIIPVIIPPSEFPKRGRKKTFRVDYQVGNEKPVEHYIYLYH